MVNNINYIDLKLVRKDVNHYLLMSDGWTIGSTEHENVKEESPIKYKLSLNNCKLIDAGFSEEEIKKESFEYSEKHQDVSSNIGKYLASACYQDGFESGFFKALEIMSSKKFTKEQMFNVYSYVVKNGIVSGNKINDYILSMIQKEWEVEMEMCAHYNSDFKDDGETHIIETILKPSLDFNGCLILKRK